MEVDNLGNVSGKPLGKKFFMNDGLVNGITGEKVSSDVKLDMMKKEANIKSDEAYEAELKEIEDYNENLKVVPEEYSKVKLNGNAILIRLFKHPSIKKVGNMYIPNRIIIPTQTEGGKPTTIDHPLQYIHAGVIYAVSDQCSETFKKKFLVGELVDLKLGMNLMQQRTWLKASDYYNNDFDNHFIINENMIEKGSY